MAACLDDSVNLSTVILNLDEISNIGHPCWEMLQPNPDVYELFDKYNNLFFDGILEHNVDLKWLEDIGDCAGVTYPPLPGENNKMQIHLNEHLLRRISRCAVIETLLHEMIHTYLIKLNKEGRAFHGKNFINKMNEINQMTGLNISIFHEYSKDVTNRGETKATPSKRDLRFMWRCRNECKSMSPFFGFIWIMEDREPQPGDSMWIDMSKCNHSFEKWLHEKDGDDNSQSRRTRDSKGRLNYWDCITIFNKFVTDNHIQIKTKESLPNSCSTPLDNAFAIDLGDSDDIGSKNIIPNASYINFDSDSLQFVNMIEFLKIECSTENNRDAHTVCMICLKAIPEIGVKEHLRKCAGIDFTDDEQLPILKTN